MAFVHDDQPQEVYDAFNKWIFSSDQKLFNKLLSKTMFVDMTKDVPGDIVELGVFKGSGVIAWLKALHAYGQYYKKCVGFDFFDSDQVVNSIKNEDQKDMMRSLFEERKYYNNESRPDHVLADTLKASNYTNFTLVRGDVTKTVPEYLELNPGFRASIINFDLDVDEPTYACLNHLWDRLSIGGIMIFDEYAVHEWTESNAVDRFCREHCLQPVYTNLFAPSAFVVKEYR